MNEIDTQALLRKRIYESISRTGEAPEVLYVSLDQWKELKNKMIELVSDNLLDEGKDPSLEVERLRYSLGPMFFMGVKIEWLP